MKLMLINYISAGGKDSVADYLCREYDFKSYGLADGVYSVARDVFGMKKKDKALLISVGEKMREIDPLCWIKETLCRIEKDNHERVVISDTRSLLEYSYLLEMGFIPVMIYCDEEIALKRAEERDGSVNKGLVLNNRIENQLRFLKEHVHVIDNSHSWSHTIQQMEKLMGNHDIKKKNACKHINQSVYMTADDFYGECDDCGTRATAVRTTTGKLEF